MVEKLWSHGKTQVWNRGGIEFEGMEDLAQRVKPDAVVWKGDPHCFSSQQGLRVLGDPNFIKEFFVKKS